jgi:predicted ABC-type ATPase
MPELYIIAGPNGAGKTTAAKTILPEVLNVIEFVNADEIAKGLSPFNPDGVSFEAGRIMLKRIDQLIEQKQNFAIETTLSTKSYLKLIDGAIEKGYVVVLIFLWLNDVEIARQRVAKRVSEGGHDIPLDVIDRRYDRGLKNLPLFLAKMTGWYIYDNSEGDYVSIAKFVANERIIDNFTIWNKIIG